MSDEINVPLISSHNKKEESAIYKKIEDDLNRRDLLFDLDEDELAFINYGATDTNTITAGCIAKKAKDVQDTNLHCY